MNSITCSTDEKGIMTITITGDLPDDDIEVTKNSLAKVVTAMDTQFTSSGNKVNVVVDIANFSGKYGVHSFAQMVKFANETDVYTQKAAIIGGSSKEKMAAEMVVALARRTNIKVFETREEALAWLAL